MHAREAQLRLHGSYALFCAVDELATRTTDGDLHQPGQILDEFGRHFALAEQAVSVDLTHMPRDPHDEAPGKCGLAGAPSLVGLAASFASLKCGKAPGITQIPPDAYSGAAAEAAIVHYTRFCSTLLHVGKCRFFGSGCLQGLFQKPISRATK